MNKTSIKVIKRKDTEIMASTKNQSAPKPKEDAPLSAEKIESRARRKLVATISNWISELRENNRNEEVDAIRKNLGSNRLAGKI